jgi:hypothetical protein
MLLLLLPQRPDGRAGFFLRKPRWFEGHLFHPFLFNDVTSVDCTGGQALQQTHEGFCCDCNLLYYVLSKFNTSVEAFNTSVEAFNTSVHV